METFNSSRAVFTISNYRPCLQGDTTDNPIAMVTLPWTCLQGRQGNPSCLENALLETTRLPGITLFALQETKHDKCVTFLFSFALSLLENVSTNSFLRSKLKYSIAELLKVLLSN